MKNSNTFGRRPRRAERRHHYFRLKEQRLREYFWDYGTGVNYFRFPVSERTICMAVTTPAPHSDKKHDTVTRRHQRELDRINYKE